MTEKLKALGAWLYEWVTVITATIVGGMATVFEVLDAFGAVDLTPLLPPEHAAKIITIIAIAKGLAAWLSGKKANEPDDPDYSADV
jgi:hypothetical protein